MKVCPNLWPVTAYKCSTSHLSIGEGWRRWKNVVYNRHVSCKNISLIPCHQYHISHIYVEEAVLIVVWLERSKCCDITGRRSAIKKWSQPLKKVFCRDAVWKKTPTIYKIGVLWCALSSFLGLSWRPIRNGCVCFKHAVPPPPMITGFIFEQNRNTNLQRST